MNNVKTIGVNCRAYEWSSKTNGPAPWPKRDSLKINEQDIPHEERYKECDAYIDLNDNVGYVEWLTQESEHPSDKFNAEIVRAFQANGFHGKINVKYGIRDNGLTECYELNA